MLTFLIRSATSQSSSYPIVLTRLGGSRSRPTPYLKIVEVPEIETVTSWLVVRHTNPQPMMQSSVTNNEINDIIDYYFQ